MLNFTKLPSGIVKSDATTDLTEQENTAVSFAILVGANLLRTNVKTSANEFCDLFCSKFGNNKEPEIMATLRTMGEATPQYIEVAPRRSRSRNSTIASINEAIGEVTEQAVEVLNQNPNTQGFPFSFVNANGENAMGIVFGEDENAYKKVEHLQKFARQSDIGQQYLNIAINRNMTLVVMQNIIRNAAFTLPCKNQDMQACA